MENSVCCFKDAKYICECNNTLLCGNHLKKHLLKVTTDKNHKICKVNTKPNPNEIQNLSLTIQNYLKTLQSLKLQIISDISDEMVRINILLTSVLKEISKISKTYTEKLVKQKFNCIELKSIRKLKDLHFGEKTRFIEDHEGLKRLEKLNEHTVELKKWRELEILKCGDKISEKILHLSRYLKKWCQEKSMRLKSIYRELEIV